MREYSKIDNLFRRNPAKKSELLLGQYTRPEFSLIGVWDTTEKVDGTNVRLGFSDSAGYIFNGRTDSAQFSVPQSDFLHSLCSNLQDGVRSLISQHGLNEMTIFGELYGPKIQSGGNYSQSLGFRSFDMLVNDKVWLAPDSVRKNAETLGLDTVPSLGVMFTQDIVEMVTAGFVSTFADNRDYIAEGVIAKPPMNLYDQRGERVLFKLKHCDLKHLS